MTFSYTLVIFVIDIPVEYFFFIFLCKQVYVSILQVIEFVKRNVGTYTPQLAGNSVYVDFAFLKVM